MEEKKYEELMELFENKAEEYWAATNKQLMSDGALLEHGDRSWQATYALSTGPLDNKSLEERRRYVEALAFSICRCPMSVAGEHGSKVLMSSQQPVYGAELITDDEGTAIVAKIAFTLVSKEKEKSAA